MLELFNSLKTMTLGELFNYIVGIIAVISLIIEKSKKLPFKPWSALVSWIGKCLLKDIVKEIKELRDETKANNEALIELDKKVDQKFKEKQEDDDTKEAKRLRARIIEFADSCRIGQHHTKTNFENVFRDYNDYVDYCEKHNIPNHFIDTEFEYIKEVYSECQKENKFL